MYSTDFDVDIIPRYGEGLMPLELVCLGLAWLGLAWLGWLTVQLTCVQ